MTEFLIVAVTVLVPLFLIIPVVAKLIALKQDTELAARYAAWERTVWYQEESPGHLDGFGGMVNHKTDEQVGREIDARILARAAEPLASDPSVPFTFDPFLRRQNGDLEVLARESVPATADMPPAYTSQHATQSSPSGDLNEAMTGLIDLVGDISRFSLNTEGQFAADVSIPVIGLGDVFGVAGDAVGSLVMRSRNVLLAESWSAGARDHAEHLVSGLLVSQVLDNDYVEEAQNAVSWAGIAREFDPDCLRFGHTDIEPLPSQRLGPAVAAPGSRGYSCGY